jgi:hypothetical protein
VLTANPMEDNMSDDGAQVIYESGQFDPEGNFLGHDTAEALLKWHEHRTVGPHRAWCYDCREWCYPADGCIRCKHPEG